MTLLALLAAGGARADAAWASPRAARAGRLLILVRGEQDRELAARVEGQTADLGFVVERREATGREEPGGWPAEARAARAHADVVIWFDGDGEGDDVIVHLARRDRVVVRRIASARGALSRSASIEAAALAIRTVLRGLAAGEAEREAERDDDAGATVRAWGELGWTALLDGTRPPGRHGVALRAGGARGRWLLGATLALLPRATADAAGATIAIERQQAGLLAGAELLPAASAPRWSVALDLGAGVARFRRSTAAAGAGLAARPASVTWSAVLAPGLRVARRVVSGAWLSLELGADVLTSPPRFGVQRSTGVEGVASAWVCEPRLALSLLLDGR